MEDDSIHTLRVFPVHTLQLSRQLLELFTCVIEAKCRPFVPTESEQGFNASLRGTGDDGARSKNMAK